MQAKVFLIFSLWVFGYSSFTSSNFVRSNLPAISKLKINIQWWFHIWQLQFNPHLSNVWTCPWCIRPIQSSPSNTLNPISKMIHFTNIKFLSLNNPCNSLFQLHVSSYVEFILNHPFNITCNSSFNNFYKHVPICHHSQIIFHINAILSHIWNFLQLIKSSALPTTSFVASLASTKLKVSANMEFPHFHLQTYMQNHLHL